MDHRRHRFRVFHPDYPVTPDSLLSIVILHVLRKPIWDAVSRIVSLTKCRVGHLGRTLGLSGVQCGLGLGHQFIRSRRSSRLRHCPGGTKAASSWTCASKTLPYSESSTFKA